MDTNEVDELEKERQILKLESRLEAFDRATTKLFAKVAPLLQDLQEAGIGDISQLVQNGMLDFMLRLTYCEKQLIDKADREGHPHGESLKCRYCSKRSS